MRVMGALNVTPDSFSDGGSYFNTDTAIAHAEQMAEDGADVIDIGGESTRPFAQPVSPREELSRVLPVVRGLVARGIRNISIDTRNASTAHACLGEGASWINDVSAFSHDQDMVHVAKNADCVVLMHARGTPDIMQAGEIAYGDVVQQIREYLIERVNFAISQGIERKKILVDPGIGFGKKLAHNIAITKNLSAFANIGAGVLYGPSRKAFIGEITGIKDAAQRDFATMAPIAIAELQGVTMVRVHNVKATVEMLSVLKQLQ